MHIQRKPGAIRLASKGKSLRISRVFLLCLLAFLPAGSASAQETQEYSQKIIWERIGSEKVNRTVETDSVSVDKDDRFRALKLRVIDAGVLIQAWTLEYRDKTVQHVPFMGFVRAGGETPPIPLHKQLKKVRFKYYSISDQGKKATIELLGRK